MCAVVTSEDTTGECLQIWLDSWQEEEHSKEQQEFWAPGNNSLGDGLSIIRQTEHGHVFREPVACQPSGSQSVRYFMAVAPCEGRHGENDVVHLDKACELPGKPQLASSRKLLWTTP